MIYSPYATRYTRNQVGLAVIAGTMDDPTIPQYWVDEAKKVNIPDRDWETNHKFNGNSSTRAKRPKGTADGTDVPTSNQRGVRRLANEQALNDGDTRQRAKHHRKTPGSMNKQKWGMRGRGRNDN